MGAGGPGEKLSMVLAGDDTYALTSTAKSLEKDLRTLPYLTNVTSSASLERPEIIVIPDLARAAELGITTDAIAQAIRVSTVGDFDARLSKLNLDTRQLDIRVRLPNATRSDMQRLQTLRIPGRGGLQVPLTSIADVHMGSGPVQIDRFDRRRNVQVSADLGGYPLGDALNDANALPTMLAMPSSVTPQQSSDAEIMGELFGGFALAMGIGVLGIYCVLVVLFSGFLQPLTILSAIPLSVGGAFAMLLLVDSELGLSSLIGLVMLMGIVTKNSILLVEYAMSRTKEQAMSERDALMDACQKRARPIVMTTIAMIAGMTPIALGLGADASFRQPMAIAVIGGLITSTALSLIVVPVVFSGSSGLRRRTVRLLRRWQNRRTGNGGEAPPSSLSYFSIV